MKFRRHHNNDGRRQIKNGGTRKFVERLARSLGVPVRGSANTGPVAGREKSVRTNQQDGAAYPSGGARTPASTRSPPTVEASQP